MLRNELGDVLRFLRTTLQEQQRVLQSTIEADPQLLHIVTSTLYFINQVDKHEIDIDVGIIDEVCAIDVEESGGMIRTLRALITAAVGADLCELYFSAVSCSEGTSTGIQVCNFED